MGFRATLSPMHFDLNMAFWVFVFVMVSFHEALTWHEQPLIKQGIFIFFIFFIFNMQHLNFFMAIFYCNVL